MIVSSYKMSKEQNPKAEIPIYNAARIKRISFGLMNSTNADEMFPSIKKLMYRSMTFSKCKFRVWQIRILESLIPALIVDKLMQWCGQKPQ
jgi:hypothetical protein